MPNVFPDNAATKVILVKDPDAVLDYTWDWSAWLDAVQDTIASHQLSTPSTTGGLVVEQSEVVGKSVVAIISGGTAGKTFPVTCHIVTADAREDDRTLYFKIVER